MAIRRTAGRSFVRQVLARTRVDGILIAGDFNIVNGAIPLILLSGPYPSHDTGLIAAELYHSDGSSTWTWDGRGMPFPSGVLDYQLYSPDSLEMRSGLIQDSEDLPASELELYGMTKGTSARTGRHRPLLAEYAWRSD